MDNPPLVSVLLSVYNGAPFLSQSVESVLVQEYPYIELLAIDDGSTDGSDEILDSFAREDRRIKVFHFENTGVSGSLNRGLELATGRYLARLDADDRFRKDRLVRQVEAMQADPGLVIIGSAYRTIDADGADGPVNGMPLSDTAIRWHQLFHCPFASSSVLLRLEVLRRNRLAYEPPGFAEDYRLWSALLEHGRGRNLPEPLADYRVHSRQVSEVHRGLVWSSATQISQMNIHKLDLDLELNQVGRLREWFYRFPTYIPREDEFDIMALVEILARFSEQPRLDAAEVHSISGRWTLKLLSVKSEGGLAFKRRIIDRLGAACFGAGALFAARRLLRSNK